MKVLTKRSELSALVLEGKSNAKIVGFVPTMGALHSGHISLVKQARNECDIVVVSVFVNPTQFNDPNDLCSYPRTPQQDQDLLASAGVDIVFMPEVEEVYPEADTRVFDFGMLDKVMEGTTRPGHFNGVAQVVSRLFDMVKPDRAYFGEKDFQQIAIIREMMKQLNIDIQLIACPIVRGEDGLALSSRNALLSAEHRVAAPEIYSALKDGVSKMSEMTPQQAEEFITNQIDANPLVKVIYIEIVDGITLQRVNSWDDSEMIQGCIAVQAGAVRLIDNIKFK